MACVAWPTGEFGGMGLEGCGPPGLPQRAGGDRGSRASARRRSRTMVDRMYDARQGAQRRVALRDRRRDRPGRHPALDLDDARRRRRRPRRGRARSAPTSTPGERVSDGCMMHIDEVELRVIRLPFKSAVQDIVRRRDREGRGHHHRAQRRRRGLRRGRDGRRCPLYREETIAGALRPAARRAGARRCWRTAATHPAELIDRWARWRGNPMAKTALELAVWDCYARQQDVPLRDAARAATRTEIPVGASLGHEPGPETRSRRSTATSPRATSGSS